MKTFFLAASGLAFFASSQAADPGALKFGGERIGVPPLSLRDSLTRSVNPFEAPQSDTGKPAVPNEPEPPIFGPRLGPKSIPDVVRNRRTPRVSREAGMPVFIPSEAVNYAMTVVPPDPNVDFKMVLKEPANPKPQVKGDSSYTHPK
jgi:hypothetical protein